MMRERFRKKAILVTKALDGAALTTADAEGPPAGLSSIVVSFVATLITSLWFVSCSSQPKPELPLTDPSLVGEAPNLMDGRSKKNTAGWSVKGKVILMGTPPPEREIEAAVGHLPCVASMPIRTRHFAIAKDGGLGDVLVRIKSRSGNPLPTFPPPGQPVVERIGCQFHPRVVAVMTNQALIIRNSDLVLQNVLATGKLNPSFSVTQTRIGQEDSCRFAVPELFVRIVNNTEPWMSAYVAVIEHAFFAVTDVTGQFELPEGLPADRYTLEAVHMKAGSVSVDLEFNSNPLTLQVVLNLPTAP